MNPDQWKTVNSMFHAALEVEQEQRKDFVRAESMGDSEVAAEVEILLLADSEAGAYLDVPASPSAFFALQESTVAAGDVLCDRFLIVREIAAGGMGQVFEAFDQELVVRIALKVIRPELSSNPDAISRFRQEVRLARTITHPNICRTFHLERATRSSGEILFLTMEFLPGETLASRIQRTGRLPQAETLAILRQVSGALDEAHSVGIVHRDMKPANIMLVPAETDGSRATRAVITDFGLARLAPVVTDRIAPQVGRSIFSQQGMPVGTLGYMAPEQLEGGPITPATDVYATALALYEMTTGKPFFKPATLLAGIVQRLNEAAPTIADEGCQIPAAWCKAMESGLRLRAADRPQSAAEMLAIVEGKRSAPRASGRWAVVPRALRRRARVAGFAALVLTMSLSVGSLRLIQWERNTHVEAGALIYLADVRNFTSEPQFDTATELLRASLAQSAQLNLVDQGRVGDILQLMKMSPDVHPDAALGREVGMRAGAARVIFAAVSGSKGSYHLDIDVQQPDNTPARYRAHWTKSLAWDSRTTSAAERASIPAGLMSSVREASNWIRHEAGESAHDIAVLDAPPEDVTTASWQALNEYALAQALVRQNKNEEAISAFQRAIHADPGFSLAYAHMGDVMVALSRKNEGYRAYMDALNSDSGRRLSRKERDFIQGSYASDTRDYATALSAFRDYSAFYPNDFNAWFYQAFPLDMMDRPQEAVKAAGRADALTGQAHKGASEVAFGYLLTRDSAAARKWIGVVRQAGRSDQALYLDAAEDFLEQEYGQAERSYRQLERSSVDLWRRFGFSSAARVKAEQLDYAGALDALAREEAQMGATLVAEDAATLVLDRAYIDCERRLFGRCVQEVEMAIQRDPSPDTLLRATDTVGDSIAKMPKPMAARALGMLKKMEEELPASDVLVIDELARQRVRGEILLASGRPREALVDLRRADSLDAPLRPRDYMARCLLAVAAQEPDKTFAVRWREEALSAYGRVALRPAVVWQRATDYPPGAAADAMSAYVRLSKTLHRQNARELEVEAVLAKLRGTAKTQAGQQ